MKEDGVTLSTDVTKAAEDYGRRCENIGKERRTAADLQDAMDHADFKKEHHALLDRLANEQRQRKPIIERPPFKTVELGTHPNNAALRKAILGADCKIGDWGADILKKVEVAKEPTDIDIIVLSVAELGFPNGATRKDIYNKALSLGLQLCPAEVGPQLRLQYLDQPHGEWILIGMEPITDSLGRLKVLGVEHGDYDRWLYGYVGGPDGFWNGRGRWAFRCK